jgi:methionyl-tRNA formyltransferase
VNNTFNLIFAGTPPFATQALAALVNSKHKVIAVYTQPDRPAGRGQKLTPSSVKEFALSHRLPVYQPLSLRDEKEQTFLRSLQADLIIVAAYGLILPKAILEAPRLGCLNIHASLLPRFRGAAPIQRAILSGDKETGITIMRMEEGLDTGPMLYKLKCPILPHDTSATLHDRLAEVGAKALISSLAELDNCLASAKIQKESLATYAHKIKKEEAKINWRTSAEEIDRHIRAFIPWPVAFTAIDDQPLRIWQADVLNSEIKVTDPGTIIGVSNAGINVATAKGVLRLFKIQWPGRRVMDVFEILNAKKNLFLQGKKFG